jgi:hypothetical protein
VLQQDELHPDIIDSIKEIPVADTASEEPSQKKQKVEQETNPQVYLDIDIGGKSAGRIVILLRADVVPSTFVYWIYLVQWLMMHV